MPRPILRRSGTRERRKSANQVERRDFLTLAGASIAGAGLLSAGSPALAFMQAPPTPPAPEGIDAKTIAEAEKLARVEFNDPKRAQILETIQRQLDLYEVLRAAGLKNEEGPAEVFDPRLPGFAFTARRHEARFRRAAPGPLPANDDDIAFAPVTSLAHWVRKKHITSERLTRIYVQRLQRLGPKLECVVTPMEEQAMVQAMRADAEIAKGKYRGPLHGIPWGAKDLFDTKGVLTTWGADPWQTRVPSRDAAVVRRLEDAGAVLVAKLTLGALAYGDIWFGGRTRNPWNTEQGSSGSSAGSAAAAAAGLVGFALGTETYGSIATPSARCGATGFRPTFGRVSRAGAMALCWSLDKVGPIARTVEDCALVLDAIKGADNEDPATIDLPLNIDMTAGIKGLKVGYPAPEYEAESATEADRAGLAALRELGVELVPVSIPHGRFGDLIFFLISVEAAAAFDEMTRTGQDDTLKWQEPRAWPNTFRMMRLASAVEYMQARRLRRRLMHQTDELFNDVHAIIAPRAHGALHAITNMTGHPAVTIRQGFREDGTPTAVTLWGRLFEDGRLLNLGATLERRLGIWPKRPPV